MPRSQAAVVAALLVAYAAFYLCRANVDAAIPFLIREHYGDKTRLGSLASAATLAYAVGKVVLGSTGDRLGGRRLMLAAIAGSVACSALFGLSGGFAGFVVFAVANRFFQAGGWPGLVQVVSQRFEPERHGLIMGILSTSYELGNVCALSLSGFVARWSWRALFIVNPALLAVLGGAAVLSLPRAAAKTRRTPDNPASADSPGDTKGAAVAAMLGRSRAFWTAVALSALLTFIRIGFLTWNATYLSEMAHASDNAGISASIVKSAIFPAAGVVAALSVGPLSDRLGAGRRAPVIALSLAVVVGLVLLLAHGRPQHPVLVIGAIGLFLLGPYSLLAGAIALDVGGTRGAATAAGVIDGAGYLGAAIAPLLLGHIADRAGWPAAFDVVAAAALLGTLISGAWALTARGGAEKRAAELE